MSMYIPYIDNISKNLHSYFDYLYSSI